MPADVTIILMPKWDSREPSCATAYVCQTARSLGCRVQYLDYNIHLFDLCRRLGLGEFWTESRYHQAWLQGDMRFLSAFLDVEEIEGDVVGFSLTATNRELTLMMARRVRERFPRKKILFGGYAVYYESDLHGIDPSLADAICKGEGEHTLRDVLARGCQNLEEVPGLYLPRGDGWRLTSPRPLAANLDEIPWPTFEETDLPLYEVPDLPLMGSRGCIGRCVFCNDRHRTPGFRTRSAAHQVDELAWLKERYDTDFFIYNDPLMNGSVRALEMKADEILRRGIDVRYGGNLMAHRGMRPELFKKLRKSGLTVAIVGLESGCTHTLRRMNKYHTAESGAAFIRACHDAGIRTELNIILGFPPETEEHFQETLRFMRDNRDHIDCVVSATTFQVGNSDMWWRRNEFDIEMADGAPTYDWRTRDGRNTFEMRVDRLRRFTGEMAELGLLPGRTDMELEQKSPETGRRFLKAYAAALGEDSPLTDGERRDASRKRRRARAEIRRVELLKACRNLGVLDQLLWIKEAIRGGGAR